MAIQSVGRTQIDSASSLSSGMLLPGADNPTAIILVAVAMAEGTAPEVLSLSWGGFPLTRALRSTSGSLVNEWWWRAAPVHGAQVLGGTISGSPRLTAEAFYVDYVDHVSPFGPIESTSGTGTSASITLTPTHNVGTIVDLFNGRDFPYGIGGSYTPGPGQGFLDLGTVGTSAGFYAISNKAASNGNSNVSVAIFPEMPWLYSAFELRAPGEPG